MVDERISKWIDEALKKGYTKEELRKKLIEKGYSESEIKSSLDNKPPKKVLIIGAMIIILAVGIIIIFSIISEKAKKSEILDEIKKEAEECAKTAPLPCMAFTESGLDLGEDYSALYYYGKAARTNDANWCYFIGGNFSISMCKAYVQKDSSFCGTLNEQTKNYCNILISSRDNAQSCYSLSKNSDRLTCLMLSTQNSSYCETAALEECNDVSSIKSFLLTENKKYCEEIANPKYKECCLAIKNIPKKCIEEKEYYLFYDCITKSNENTVCEELK